MAENVAVSLIINVKHRPWVTTARNVVNEVTRFCVRSSTTTLQKRDVVGETLRVQLLLPYDSIEGLQPPDGP